MLNNIETEFNYDRKTKKARTNIYKTESGDFFKIIGQGTPVPADVETLYNMPSPGLLEFYAECLRKPVYCDMSLLGNGIGASYVFCETFQKLAIIIGNIITETDEEDQETYSLTYQIFEKDATTLEDGINNPGGAVKIFEWSASNIPIVGSIDSELQKEVADNFVIDIGYAKFSVRKSDNRRKKNEYKICSNYQITAFVEIELTENRSEGATPNPLQGSKFSVSVPIDGLGWDNAGNLMISSGTATTTIGDLQIEVAINIDQDSGWSVGCTIASEIYAPTQTIVSGQVTGTENLRPLSDMSVDTTDLGGWANGAFTNMRLSVEFSDQIVGKLFYSPNALL